MRVTVKFGGSILEHPDIAEGILGQVAAACAEGNEVILVHGGGKSLNRRLEQMRIESRFEHGLRVTDGETLKVAVMVLAGEVNKHLVRGLAEIGQPAVGICGADASAVICRRVGPDDGIPAGVDYGFVGVPSEVRRQLFDTLLGAGIVPVVASIAIGHDARLYNVNADQMASACAWGANCSRLVYLTDVEGVLGPDGNLARELKPREVEEWTRRGTIAGGMLPKTRACLEALARGVEAVHVVRGSGPGVLTALLRGELDEGTRFHGE